MDPKNLAKLAKLKEEMERSAATEEQTTLDSSAEALDYQEDMTQRRRATGKHILQDIYWGDQPTLLKEHMEELDQQRSENSPTLADQAIEQRWEERKAEDRANAETRAKANMKDMDNAEEWRKSRPKPHRWSTNESSSPTRAENPYVGKPAPIDTYEEKYADLAEEHDTEPTHESVHRNQNADEFNRRNRDRENLNYQNKAAMAEAEKNKAAMAEAERDEATIAEAERSRQNRWKLGKARERLREFRPITPEDAQRWTADFDNKQAAAELRAEQSRANHAERELASVYERAEHVYNFYEDKFEHHRDEIVPKYLTAGVYGAIERGNTAPLTSTLLRSGFEAIENKSINKRMDPEQILGNGTSEVKNEAEEIIVDAKRSEIENERSRVKTRINRGIIKNAAEEITEDELSSAKRKGSLIAINTGARIDEETGDVIFSIPVDKGKEIREFMESSGINFEDDTDAGLASYQGFANIIEAIKDKKSLTEKGFATLDWYYDNFHYEDRIEEFTAKMEAAQEFADEKWGEKYEEYMEHRRELERPKNQRQNKVPTAVEEIEQISEEDFLKEAIGALGSSEEEYEKALSAIISAPVVSGPLRLFPDKEKFPVYNPGNTTSSNNTSGPSIKSRLINAVNNYLDIKSNIDPNVLLHRAVFVDSGGKKTSYHVMNFQQNNSNVAIAIPLGLGQNAAYVWIGDKNNTNLADWTDAFVQNPNPNMPSSKYQARQRSDVETFNHISAYKQGRNAAQNVWHNLRRYINNVA